MTWNQIYQTIADALGKPLNALHVASDFLARHGENYDFRGELLGDKAATVVFDNKTSCSGFYLYYLNGRRFKAGSSIHAFTS